MKSNVTTQRMSYLQPVCTFVNVQLDSHILVISGTTTNPVEEVTQQVAVVMDLLQIHSQAVLLILSSSQVGLHKENS